jgi:peptidoglycan/LPS O-acetylase OafA/YrhL
VLGTLFSGRVLQFYGRISYSLYLVHVSIGLRFVAVTHKRVWPQIGASTGVVELIGGLAVSTLAAWCVYRAVELPSVELAKRFKLPARVSIAGPAIVGSG